MKPSLLILLLLPMFLMACTASPASKSKVDRLLGIARAIGDPVIQAEGAKLVLEYAPELMPVLDANGDGVITLAELEGAEISEEAAAILLVQVVKRLLDK